MANLSGVYTPIIESVFGAAGPGPVEAALVQVAALAAAPVAPAVVAEFPFPRNAQILAELTEAPANWPVVIEHHNVDFVLPQMQAIPATPVAGVPSGAPVAWNTPAQLDRIVRQQSDVAFTVPATNS